MSAARVPLLDDDTLAFGEEDLPHTKSGNLTHPYVTFFHLAFRGAALFVYLLCGLFINSFITSFVLVVLLLSMDFWTVKNITGRLMVGLRWWNYVDDDGKSHWVFESRKGPLQNRINSRESSIFWLALILTPILWGLLFIIALFSFNLKWTLLVVIALILNGANFYGFFKCRVGTSESITSATKNFLQQQVLQSAVSMVAKQASSPASNSASQPLNTV